MDELEKKLKGFLDNYEKTLSDAQKDGQDYSDRKIAELKSDFEKQLNDYSDSVRANNVELGLSNKEKEKFSWSKAIRAILINDFKDAGYEKEIFTAAREKAVDTTSGTRGGFLVPVELAMDQLIRPALANTVIKELGTTVWEGLVDDIDIPEAENRPKLTWLRDSDSVGGTNIDFAKKTLNPKTGSMLVKVGNKLLKQTSNVADTIIKSLMQEGITLGMDEIAIVGTGSDSEPRGILNYSGFNDAASLGTNGGRLTVDDVAAMLADAQDQDFLKIANQGGLLSHPRVISGLKRERVAQFAGDTSGQPLIMPLMTDAMLETTIGMKVRSTTNVPKNIIKGSSSTLSSAVVGEWAQFIMGIWGGITLRSSTEAGEAFVKNQTWIVVFLDMDTQLKHPKAFTLLQDAETLESKW